MWKYQVGDVVGDYKVIELYEKKQNDNRKKVGYSLVKWLTLRHKCGADKKCHQSAVAKTIQRRCIHYESVTKGVKRISDVEAFVKSTWYKYKAAAIKRNYEFNLTVEELENIIFENCFYCGREPYIDKYIHGPWSLNRKKFHIKSNGIDRVDNNVGYRKGNVEPCCYLCNQKKLAMSLEEWDNMVELWYESLVKRCG